MRWPIFLRTSGILISKIQGLFPAKKGLWGGGQYVCKQLPTVLEQVSITGYSIKRDHFTSKLNPRHGSLLPGSPGCHPTRSQVLYRP